MILTGIGDEAGNTIDAQIRATQELGWKHLEMRGVEVPGFPKANFHEIPDKAFGLAADKLKEAGLNVYCFGSTIMNWAKTVETPFDVTLAEVGRCIPRMQRLGTKFVRIMSFKPGDAEAAIPAVVFDHVREVTKRFLDAGITPVHENCMNYGGMSWRHALELLEKVPGLKWVFDTANPVFNADRVMPKPWPQQDPWEFWTHLRDHTVHIHIKDATWNPAKKDSIEPHMVVVFHDAQSKSNDDAMRANFVEYGHRVERMISGIKSDLAKEKPNPPRLASA